MNAQSSARIRTVATLVASALLAGGCVDARTTPVPDPPPPVLRTTPAPPVPTGRPVDSPAQFDRDPCAVATVEELGVAIAEPYDLLAANVLRPDGPASPSIAAENRSGAVGCGYRFVAPNDVAEAYHWVTVRVTRWTAGGPALLASCRKAVAAQPKRFRPVELGDESCLGPDAVVSVRIGRAFYSVAASAKPLAADPAGEDVSLGAIAAAAAGVLVPRLPRA